jgi:hypothetical protein
MDHPRATVRRTFRLLCAVGLAMATTAMLAPVASARDSTFRITLTLRGQVDDDVGFGLTAGGIFFDSFCEFPGLRDEGEQLAPLCRPDVPYTITVTVGEGEELDYSISKMWLHEAHTLWINTLTGDGRDHTLSYVYLFDLPATDTLPPLPGPITRLAGQPL